MLTKHELTLQVSARASVVKGLLARAEELEQRALALIEKKAPEAADEHADLRQQIEQFSENGFVELAGALKAQSYVLEGVAESVQNLANSLEEMPERLSGAVLEEIDQFGERLESQIQETVENVETMISETEERIRDAIEQTEERLEALVDGAEDAVKTGLDEVNQVFGEAKRDVDKILSSLEQMRKHVLSICRVAGIGASSAEPAVGVAVSAFSAVG